MRINMWSLFISNFQILKLLLMIVVADINFFVYFSTELSLNICIKRHVIRWGNILKYHGKKNIESNTTIKFPNDLM